MGPSNPIFGRKNVSTFVPGKPTARKVDQAETAKPKAAPSPFESVVLTGKEAMNLQAGNEVTNRPETPSSRRSTSNTTETNLPTKSESGFSHPDRVDTQVEHGANGTLLQFEQNDGIATPGSFKNKAVNFLESGIAKENGHGVLLAADANQAMKIATVASDVRTIIPGPMIPAEAVNSVAAPSAAAAASSPLITAAASAGGGLLLAHGVTKALFGKGAVERLGGVSEANWGGQTLLSSAATATTSTLSLAAKALGVVGGTIQVGLGLNKTGEGLGLLKNENGEKVKSKEKVGLGLVDTAAGSSWILASFGVAPAVTMPTFIALTVGSKAYQHRDKIAGAAIKGAKALKNLPGKLVRGAKALPGKMMEATERISQHPQYQPIPGTSRPGLAI